MRGNVGYLRQLGTGRNELQDLFCLRDPQISSRGCTGGVQKRSAADGNEDKAGYRKSSTNAPARSASASTSTSDAASCSKRATTRVLCAFELDFRGRRHNVRSTYVVCPVAYERRIW